MEDCRDESLGKTLGTKPENLSSICEIHMIEGER